MPFPWSPCQASVWHALRIGCHPLEGICEQMEGYIFRNKSVCTKKPEPQLGLSFPVEFVFSPSRPSLKTWVQFHASQQVCIGYLLFVPAVILVTGDGRAKRQTKSCHIELTRLLRAEERWGETLKGWLQPLSW